MCSKLSGKVRAGWVPPYLFVSLSLLTFGQASLAQPSDCQACRTVALYGNCPETAPPAGHIAFIGKVVAANPIKCGTQIRVNVTRSSAPSLPSTIEIDVSACMAWMGAVGDSISAVIAEAPTQSGAYSAQTCTPTASQ